MQWLLAHLPGRSAFAAGGFVLLFALEQLLPFKKPVDRRLRRYARNVFLTVFNGVAMHAMIGGAVVAYTAWLADSRIGLLHFSRLPAVPRLLLAVAALDLATYAFHWAYHTNPLMWRLHRVHHSDLDLDVTSASRFHLAEIVLSTVYRIGVITWLGPTWSEVVVFESGLLFFSQFEHSNLKFSDAWDRRLRTVFVTPDMHRVHHSDVRGHTNSNYSTIFSFWDRLFGTYVFDGVSQDAIKIGIPEYKELDEVTLPRLLAMPLGAECQVAGRSPAPHGSTLSPV